MHTLIGGEFYPGSLKKIYDWAKPSPRSNPVIMHRTITGILRKIREIEALSMGVETLRGYNLDRLPYQLLKRMATWHCDCSG
jgi:hypothetical protein